MSKVTPQMVKELRERTGVGMAKCKEALDKVGGDMEKAIDELRKSGMASAVKKEGREAKEGLVGIGESKDAIALVEVNSETDFVAQNDKFKHFLRDVSNEAASLKPSSIDKFLAAKCKHDPSLTIDQYRALIVQSLGENIQIKRLKIFPKSHDVSIGVYSHMNGKIVAVVELTGGQGHEALARDIAMHVAAESPEYLEQGDVPHEILKREEEIALSQIKNKPKEIIDKIVSGKVKAYYDQVCLLNQKYIKDTSLTIAQLLENSSKAGKKHVIRHFLRWQVGA